MELISFMQLAYFAALFVGVALGGLIGWLTRFELGLGVGLLVPGLVAAGMGLQCLDAYRAFSRLQTHAGAVVEVRDEAANGDGSITHEVPYVRYRDAAGVVGTVAGPTASGWQVGQRVRVLADGVRPALRQRIADPAALRGGAIAMMLFGTFPLSLGVWFTVGALCERAADRDVAQDRSRSRRRGARAPTAARETPAAARLVQRNTLFLLSLFGALLWIGAGRGTLLERFAVGFGLIAALLLLYAAWLGLARRGARATRYGLVVLALNFGVFAFALWLLSPAGGG